jgi:uncharacterized membrane protein YkgB
VVELAAAVLLAIKPLAPKLSIIGSLLAIVLFVSTASRQAVASRRSR